MASLVAGERARMYALAGVARAGATRAGYVSGKVFISYGGTWIGWGKTTPNVGVLIGSLSINQELDETPDTCRFTVNGTVPSIGDPVAITLGSKNAPLLFAGYALTVSQKYVGDRPANVQADVVAVDYTWQLGFHMVTAQYRGQTAGAIVKDLVARFAAVDGFTATAVDPALIVLDEITFTNEDLITAITRTVRRAGAYWYCDYTKNVHVFLTETLNGAPEALTPAHKSLAHVTRQIERTQVLTRVFVEGRGSRLLANVASGDTKIPLDAIDMFAVAPDVFVKASFQGAEGGAQHLNFSGVIPGGGGSVVGPGMGPTVAPALAIAAGSGVDAGAHSYAITFTTASGESLPGPASSISVAPAPPTGPASAPVGATTAVGGNLGPGYYNWAYSFVVNGVESFMSPRLAMQFFGGDMLQLTFVSGPVGTSARRLYRTPAQASAAAATAAPLKLLTVVADNSTLSFWDHYSDSVLTTTAPVFGAQVALSGIPIGPAATTGRKIYRTAAVGGSLKLAATIANNTATTHTDAVADSALGAVPPVTDTSGLTQPNGQILPGATSLPIAGNAPFETAGGWAIIGNGEQVIRYTGVTAGALTGIPASGAGAITATVVYNSTVTAAPMLIGIPATGTRSIVRALTAGDEMYLVVQMDDAAAQAALAADVGGTGIREEWVQDRRLSIEEARARGRATIALRPLDVQTLGYTCRDLRTAVGKTVTVNLPAPTNIVGTYRIQAVTIDNFRPNPTQYPTFTVRASSSHFSFDDWLRRMRTEV
jgi:hypothetical protein